MAIVTLAHISVTLRGKRVLRDLNAQVQPGEQVLLTGPNGAGKTTLLRVIATALRPQGGTLALFGGHRRTDLLAARPRLALMTHQHYFYEALTARQNLRLVAKLAGRADDGLVSSLLQEVGLDGQKHKAVADFSAGMKRRLALARVKLLQPELVLMDEPFGQLDPQGVALMEQAFKAWAQRGATVVMATHDIERGQALCGVHWHLDAASPGLETRELSRP